MNIVFDLGGVVFDWQPDTVIRRAFQDPRTQDLVRAEILEHADWVELDRGSIALSEAIVRGASRTGLPHKDIEALFNQVPPSLTPIQETIDLIRSVRDSDNRVFVLSNMALASITYLEKQHEIWDMFDGIIISCRIQKVKPEIEIYEHLLTEYQLEATETVFIDDLSENLAAASSIGIQTIKFVDPSQCRRDLVDLNCL
ncbi:MAG: HAD family phosphatase [Gammaproteobacteria bacterium]|nr:HAD family phosphatase [Gammaproteobacteria bacterium]